MSDPTLRRKPKPNDKPGAPASISRRKAMAGGRARDRLRQSEDAFRQLFDSSPVALVLWRVKDARVIMLNIAAARLFGSRLPDLREAVRAGAAGPLLLSNAAGDASWGLISNEEVRFHDVDCNLTSIVDVTKLRNFEHDLRLSEARFRDLTELSSDWFWEQDEHYRFTMVSSNVLRYTGLGPEARLGRTRWDFPALNLSAADWNAHRAVLDARRPFHDFEVRRPDIDGRAIWTSVSGMPLFDGAGKFTGYRGVGRDISNRKREERKLVALNAQLEARVAQRTAELSRSNQELESFSYTVAHDLRAPLRAILGFGRFLLEDHGDRLPPDALENLRRVLASGTAMGRMIDGLLRLSLLSRQPVSMANFDIASISRELLAELAAAEPGRTVEFVAPDSLPAAGDVSLLRIALQNLLGNAWKFTARSNGVRIEVGKASTAKGDAFFVRDNGVGFDMAYAGKLFRVFQRLHSDSEFDGIGVGLATVTRILHLHGGRIWAESAPGAGATFFFTLPARP